MTDLYVTIDGGGAVTGVFEKDQPTLSTTPLDSADSKMADYYVSLAQPVAATAMNEQLLFIKRAANMQSTSDQVFTKLFTGTIYMPTRVIGKRVSGGASVACLGGLYTAASKGGHALVANTQDWINLTADKKIVAATLAAIASTESHTETPYLSLSTGSTAACAADIYVFGVVLD